MDKSALNQRVLVLNKHWFPIAVCTVKDAIVKATADQFGFVDHESFMVYNWSSWLKEFQVPNDSEVPKTMYVAANRYKVQIPEVAVCYAFEDIPEHSVKLTKTNIYYRDQGRCQYTNKKLSMQEFTIDHVIPSSRGGKSTWDNLVTCDRLVNHRKGNKTPKEAGLTLMRQPKKPQWSPILKMLREDDVPKSWKNFLQT